MRKKQLENIDVVTLDGNQYAIVAMNGSRDMKKLLKLIEFANNKLVIHNERRLIIRFLLYLLKAGVCQRTGMGIEEMTEFIYTFFEFRKSNYPDETLKLNSFKDQVYKIQAESCKKKK